MSRESVTVPKTDEEVAAAAGIEPRQPGETDEQYAERLADALAGNAGDEDDDESGAQNPTDGDPQPSQLETEAAPNYESWTGDALTVELEARGLPKGGNKAAKVARLIEADAVPTDVDKAPPAEVAPVRAAGVKHAVLHSAFRYTDDTHRRLLREGESAEHIPAAALARGIAVGAIAKD